jgi:hypothetical protein
VFDSGQICANSDNEDFESSELSENEDQNFEKSLLENEKLFREVGVSARELVAINIVAGTRYRLFKTG